MNGNLKSRIALTIIIVCVFTLDCASAGIKIKGIVIDSISKRPLYKASIALMTLGSNKIITGTETDSAGCFVADGVNPDNYILRISFLGYKSAVLPVELRGGKLNEVNMGIINLQQDELKIGPVEIKADNSGVTYNSGKIIIDVRKLKISDNETVADILKKIPELIVDDDGVVHIYGKPEAGILVDGKESAIMTGDFLKQFSAYNIDKIEIESLPSAKYDADGRGNGVINIISKKKSKDLLKSRTGLSWGNMKKKSASQDINYNPGNIKLFGNYYYNKSFSDGSFESIRTNPVSNIYLLKQNGNSAANYDDNAFKFGVDYLLSRASRITTNMAYKKNNRNYSTNEDDFQSDYNLASPIEYSYHSNNKGYGKTTEYRLEYTNEASSIDKYEVGFYYSAVNNKRHEDRNTIYYTNAQAEMSFSDYWNKNKTCRIYFNYKRNISDSESFETGFKTTLRNRTASYFSRYFDKKTNDWQDDISENNEFELKDGVWAAYINYSYKISIVGFSAGLRGEYVRYKTNQITTKEKYKNGYFDLFPSLNIDLYFSEESPVNISYSRDITRPFMGDFNPFVIKETSTFWTSGNPRIKPNYQDEIEINKNIMLKSTPVTISLRYSYSMDGIDSPGQMINDSVYLSIRKNDENARDFEFSINSSVKFGTFLTLYPVMSFMKKYITNTKLDGEILRYNYLFQHYGLRASLTLFGDINVNANFLAFPKYYTPLYISKTKISSSLSIIKNFFGNKMSLTFNLSPLIKLNKTGHSYDKTITWIYKSSPAKTFYSISVSYNFNKFKEQKIKGNGGDNGSNDY